MQFKFDHRYTFQTPQGTISDTGIELIQGYLVNQKPSEDQNWIEANNEAVTLPNLLPLLPESWEWVWLVTGKAQYVGTFPKRISKYYYTTRSLKVPNSVMSEVGNLARTHSSESITYHFDFVTDLNWQAGDFGDGRSCFWGGRESAREMIKDAGGFAIRFFEDDKGVARAWIIPSDNVYYVFNGYGHQTVKIARIFSTFLGLSYKKVSLSNHGGTSSTLYINTGRGYAIGEHATIEHINSHDFEIYDDEMRSCSDCGDYVDEDNLYVGLDDEIYCQDCYYDRFRDCDECGESQYTDDLCYIESEGIDVCEGCYDRNFSHCEGCEKAYRLNQLTVVKDSLYCADCLPKDTSED